MAAAGQALDAHIRDGAAAQNGNSELPSIVRHGRRIGVLHSQGLGEHLGLGPALAAGCALIDFLQSDQIWREAGQRVDDTAVTLSEDLDIVGDNAQPTSRHKTSRREIIQSLCEINNSLTCPRHVHVIATS